MKLTLLPQNLKSLFTYASSDTQKPIETRFQNWAQGDITEEKLLETLVKLENKVPTFDHLQYGPFNLHAALQEFLDCEIRPERIREDCHEVPRRTIQRSTIQGGLVYIPETEHLKIEIPATLPDTQLPDLLTHELSHLLLGHALPAKSLQTNKGSTVEFWILPASAYPNRLPFDLKERAVSAEEARVLVACFEGEAEQATRYLRSISAYGRSMYQREDLLLGL